MDKLEQMEEFITKVKKDEELQKELVSVLESGNPDDTAEADKWLADNGYGFTVKELGEHLQDGVPLTEDQLEAVAGGGVDLFKLVEVVLTSVVVMEFLEFNKKSGGHTCASKMAALKDK